MEGAISKRKKRNEYTVRDDNAFTRKFLSTRFANLPLVRTNFIGSI